MEKNESESKKKKVLREKNKKKIGSECAIDTYTLMVYLSRDF